MRSHAKAASAGSSMRQTAGHGRIVRGAFATGGVSSDAHGSSMPSRSRPAALALAIAALALTIATFLLCAIAPSAQAAKTVVQTIGSTAQGTTGGLFNQARDVAVNEAGAGGVPAGTFYVADGVNNRIQRFAPDGSFVAAWGWDVNAPDGNNAYEICTLAADCLKADGGFNPGQLGTGAVQGIAVDQANGIVYVSDQTARRIHAFSAAGVFEGAFGWGVIDASAALQFCTTTCVQGLAGANPGELGAALGGLAFDPAGKLYVADKANRRVDVFTPTLTAGAITGVSFTEAFGWDVANTGDPGDTAPTNGFEVCTTVCKAPGTAGTQAGNFATNSPADLALDGDGNVYALDALNKRIQKFDTTPAPVPAPTFDSSSAISSAFGGSLYAIAYDTATDSLFLAGSDDKVTLADTGTSTGTLTVQAAGGNYKLTFGAQPTGNLTTTATAAAVQTALEGLSTIGAGNVTVTGGPGDLSGTTPYTITFTGALAGHAVSEITADTTGLTTGSVRVLELEPDGDALAGGLHGPDLTAISATGLTVAPPDIGGGIFLSSVNPGHFVFILNTPPAATLGDPGAITTSAATLSGTADPTGGTLTCKFQYSTDASTWIDVPELDCATLAPGGGPQPISENIDGLESSQLYFVRLTVTKSGGAGTVTTPIKSFITAGVEPVISETAASGVAVNAATLNAKVNPRNQATTYHFEYGSQGPCAANPCTSTPELSAGTGSIAALRSRAITGLSPATTYHFRIVATNASSPPGGTVGPDATFTTYAPEPPLGTCANDTLRSGASAKLPDCRAYEQASPVDKNGQDALGLFNNMAAAEDGDAVMYYSINGQPGSVNSSFPFFLARRSPSQWSAQGLKPSNTLYGGSSQVAGWLPDFSTVFLQSHFIAGGGNFFLARASEDASLTTIVDGDTALTDMRSVGASADGSVVYFLSGSGVAPLAPGAPAGKPNLYVWNRDANTLTLAGVLPDSACASLPCVPIGGSAVRVANPAPGPFDPNGDESYTHETHVVSESGDAYFNDAGTGQLYLRKDPIGSPSTAAVSASQRTDCAGDPTCGGDDVPDIVPSGLPATFQGATSDGAQAFFTSAGELTEDANTGPSVEPPAIGRADKADGEGIVKALVPLTSAPPVAVDADADHLYWIEPGGGAIARSDLNGNNVDLNFIAGLNNAKNLALDSTRHQLYWINAASDAGDKKDGTIGRADLPADPNGAATNVNQSCITGLDSPRGIEVNESLGLAYWLNRRLGPALISHADISGSCAAADTSKNLTFSTQVPGGTELAVGDSYIYTAGSFSDSGPVRITAWNIGDGSDASLNTSVSTSGDLRVALAVDGSHVYYSNPGSGAIGQANLDLSSPDDSFISGITAPIGLALGQGIDSGHLYWATGVPSANRGKDLYRYDASSGNLTDLTPDQADPLGADVRGVLGASDDGSYVYFVANADLDGAGPASGGDCKGSTVTTAAAAFSNFSGQCSIYLAHDGETTFVARLDTGGKNAGQSDALNWIGAGNQRVSRVSIDGILLFRSQRLLAGYDNNGLHCVDDGGVGGGGLQPGRCPELYRYVPSDATPTCITCNPTGIAPLGPPRLAQIDRGVPIPSIEASTLTRNLSSDGNRVFFESPDKLVASDTNGDSGCPQVAFGNSSAPYFSCQDVYEWEAEGTGTCQSSTENGGCLYLISTGTATKPAFFLDASTSGEDAFFFTREKLVPQDTDDLLDVYDARIDGGLTAQHEVAAAPCEGDACHGAPSASPDAQGSATAVFSGQGDPTPQHKAHKKKKKKHRKRGRRAGHHQRHHSRTADHHRRAHR